MVNGSVTLQSWNQYFPSPWSYVYNYDPTGHAPDDQLNGTPESWLTPRWMAKLGFAVQLPFKLNLAGSMIAREGFVKDNYYIDYSGASVSGTPDRPGAYSTIYLGRRGDYRYDNVFVANLRLERAFKINFARLIFSIDLFNVFNTYTVQGVEENAGRSTFGDMRTIISPRIFRLGVRLDF